MPILTILATGEVHTAAPGLTGVAAVTAGIDPIGIAVDGSTPLNRANMMKIENELTLLDGSSSLTNTVLSATPPGSPADGQLWFFPAYAGVVWQFRYNAGSASAYKWEFVGGPPFMIFAPDYTPPTAGTWYTDTTPGSTILVARAGEYIGSTSANLGAAAGNTGNYLAFTPVQPYRYGQPSGGASMESSISVSWWLSITAGYSLRNDLLSVGVSAVFGKRTLSLIPQRVS
jgi:hypothetical protein